MGDQGIAAWKFPLIISAIAVSIIGGFYLGGPGLGMAVGALAASTIVVMAVRKPPLYPIVPAPVKDLREHLLVVVAQAGVDATARIGDEDIVQTVTDQLHEYPATEVFLVTGTESGASAAAAEELRSRLHAPLHVVRA